MDRLAIVVPCYNEEEMLPITTKELTGVLDDLIRKEKIASNSYILYVDDGSKDATWELIEKIHKENKKVFGLKLAGNVGHQFALTAGMMQAKEDADILISIDADLQDDTLVMEDMIDKYHEGNDIVYGVRNDRKKDSFFKRTTAQMFYKILAAMGVKTVYNHADYRLMSKVALEGLAQYREVNLFLRGIVPEIGYKTAVVYYDRGERFAGESKYPLKKMISFAIEGISSFSVKPLKMISTIGILISLLSGFGLLYALISKICGVAVPGWTAIVCSIWLLGGVQLLCLGVLGGYVGKIYQEVKARPRYIIEKKIIRQDDPEKDLQEGKKEN